REDRVADRRRGRRHARLAYAARRRVALDEVDMGLRRDVGARNLVVAEIALLDTSPLEADAAVEGVADRHDNGALELGAHAVRIDDQTAIDGDIDPGYRDRPVVADGHLGNHRDVAQEAAMDRDPTSVPRRQRLAPFAVLHDEVENAAQAAGVDRIQ